MSKHIEAAAAFPRVANGVIDHKAWAKRILWREERGDKSLMPIQVKFAKEGLEIKEEKKG